jgi:hypothetical protein
MVEGVTAHNLGNMRSRVAARVRYQMRGKIAQDADIYDLVELLDAFEEVNEAGGEMMGAPGGEPPGGEMVDAEVPPPPMAAPPAAGAGGPPVAAPAPAAGPPEEEEEPSMEMDEEGGQNLNEHLPEPIEHVIADEVYDRRAWDARAALGRDETEEEMAEREEAEDAKFSRDKLGRDEEEADCQDRRTRASDSRSRRMIRDQKRAADARGRLGRDETEKECYDRRARDRAMDRKRAADARRAFDQRRAADQPPDFSGKPEVGGGMSQDQMRRVISSEVRLAQDRMNAKFEAERFVRPWVGEFAPETSMALDNADAVYRKTLSVLGVKTEPGWPTSALKAILASQPRLSTQPSAPRFATDAAPSKTSFSDRFPGANRIRLSA